MKDLSVTTTFDTMISLDYAAKKLGLRLTLTISWRDPGE